jgi:DNA-binding CsgD family transcriptional regulator
VADPLRVFIASTTAHEREDLTALAHRNGWRLVSEPAFADLVLASPEEWLRRAPRRPSATVRNEAPVEGLTPREFEVLRLVADGLHNREIADRIGVTEHTVKFHLGAIFGKLGASTRTEAVRKGLRLGVIEI